MKVRENLRYSREARELTMKQVEVMTNGDIKAVTLGSWERGTRMLSVAQLKKLSRVYGLTILEVVGILGDFDEESPL